MAIYGWIRDEQLVRGLDIRYLKYGGLWGILNSYRSTGKKSAVFHAWRAISILLFTPLLVLSTCGPFITELGLEGLTLIILNPLSILQTVLKFSMLWFGVEKQCRLLDLFKDDFLTSIPPNKKPKASQILTSAARKSSALVYLGVVVDFMVMAIWNGLPVLRSEYFRENTGITAFGTPTGPNKILGFWYPFDHENTPYVQIIYCYEFVVCFWSGYIIMLGQCLIVQIVMMFTANIRVLHYLLEDLKTGESNLNTKTLLVYVKEHQKLIKVGDEMRDLYNELITFQLSTGLLIMIITIFNFILSSGNGDVVIMIKFTIYLMYTLVEVALYCYISGDLETTSEEIRLAAYCSEWYTKGVDFRKTLLMIMMRSRNSLALKFGLTSRPVNATNLTNILQTAYSSSMLLYKVTSNDEVRDLM